MSQEYSPADLSIYLKDHSDSYHYSYLQIPGCDLQLTYPCYFVKHNPMEVFDYETLNIYEAMYELFEKDGIPEKWVDFLLQVSEGRKEKGLDTPIDLVAVVHQTLNAYPVLAQSGGLPLNGFGERMEDCSNADRVRSIINDTLSFAPMREKLYEKSVIASPDVSPAWTEVEEIRSLFPEGAVHIDIGCGVGRRTVEYSDRSGMTIGVERQFHPTWYEPWKDQSSHDALFVRADGHTLPFADNCVDVVTLEFVVDHVSQTGLDAIILEASRVLKSGGVVIVLPCSAQYGYNEYAVFEKQEIDGDIKFTERRITSN